MLTRMLNYLNYSRTYGVERFSIEFKFKDIVVERYWGEFGDASGIVGCSECQTALGGCRRSCVVACLCGGTNAGC